MHKLECKCNISEVEEKNRRTEEKGKLFFLWRKKEKLSKYFSKIHVLNQTSAVMSNN